VPDAFVLLLVERVKEAGVLEGQLGGATTGCMCCALAELSKGRDAFQDQPISGLAGVAFNYSHCQNGRTMGVTSVQTRGA
jgi:hypothetical protein